MAVNENDIGLVSYEEFDSHQKNSDTSIQHVTADEKSAWNAKADDTSLSAHKGASVLDHPDESVTTAKLADEGVTTPKIADGAVTKDKLDPVTVQTPLDAAGTHAADKTNPHAVTKTQVGLGNVDNVKQATKQEFDAHREAVKLDHPDGSVTTDKLADGAVVEGKIGSGAVTATKLGASAVETAKIKDGAVTKDKIGTGAVETEKVADGAITSAKIGAGAVEAANVKDGAIIAAKLGASAVETDKIKDGAVTAAKIGASAVETDKIKDSAVTKTKIADGAISEGKFDSELSAAFTGKENIENKGQPNGYAPLDASGKIPNGFLYGQTVKEYGVRWKGTSSTVCERLGDAVGLVANAHSGSYDPLIRNDFDSIYPWSEMRTCNIDTEGNILAFKGDPMFKRDGTNGDVMVRIPKFYYKRTKTSDGYEEWWICAVKLPGYELHPLFINDGEEISEAFLAAYNLSTEVPEGETVTIARSISGVQPTVRKTRANFRTYARAKGSNWGIEDLSSVHARQMLYLIEYADTNSQSKLGNGASSLQYANTHLCVEAKTDTNEFYTNTTTANKYKVGQRIEIGTSQGNPNKTTTPRSIVSIVATEDDADISVITFDGDPVAEIAVGNMIWNVAPLNGSCDNLNGESGYFGLNGYDDVSYRGIEGFHGKLFGFIDGVNIKEHKVYYANSVADYADGVFTGKYRPTGYTNAVSNGYVSAFGYDEIAPWVMFPIAASGGSTTYVPDYYYQNTGERLLLLGGSFADGTYDGVFCFYCRSAFSSSYLHFGARLLIKKP